MRHVNVDLSYDIWLMVLDLTILQSDIATLCLVSKALHSVAVTRLYHTVRVRLWDEWSMQSFNRSMEAGATRHLQKTRSLILEDVRPPEEPHLIQPIYRESHRPAEFSTYLRDFKKRERTVALRNESIENVIKVFPRSKVLRSFCFISERTMARKMFRSVLMEFPGLTHVSCTIDQISWLPQPHHVNPIALNIRNLELCLTSAPELRKAIKVLSLTLHATLQRLSLNISPPVSQQLASASLKAGVRSALPTSWSPDSPPILPKLREIALRGMDLSEIHGSLSALIDLNSLERLTLARCDAIYDFFAHIHLDSRAGCVLPNLQHLDIQATEFDNVDTSGANIFETGQGCLESVLSSAQLKSLHLSGIVDKGMMADQIFEISLRNHSLVSFSAHVREKFPIDRFFEISDIDEVGEALDEAIRGCPNLRALGWTVPEWLILTRFEYEHETMKDRFTCALSQLPDLRVLHLRQRNFLEWHWRSGTDFNPDAVTFAIHRWANSFFNALHKRKQNPKLQALVIGSYIEDRDEERDGRGVDDGHEYFPQNCFLRGMQTDLLGRTTAVAVPVTRAILRAAEPLAEILDYDPECSLPSATMGRLSIQ